MSAIGMWETGKRQPDLDTVKKLAAFFDVTVDCLMGNQQSSIDYSYYQMASPEFAPDFKMRIRNLMAEQKISEKEFAKRTGFNYEEKDSYLYGNRIPSIEDLIKIAGALKVSTDYLLDMSQRKRISPEDELLLQTITDRERNLIDTFRQLTMDNQDIIVGEAKKALKEQRYESVAADPSLRKNGTDNTGK